MEGEKNFENFQLHWVARESHQNHHPFLLGVSGLRSCFKWRRQWWRRLTTSVCKTARHLRSWSYSKQVRMKLEKWWFDVIPSSSRLVALRDPFFRFHKHSQHAVAVCGRCIAKREIVTFCCVLAMMKNYHLTTRKKKLSHDEHLSTSPFDSFFAIFIVCWVGEWNISNCFNPQ